MTDDDRLGFSLFALRLSIFVVMAVWTADKFLNPGHAAGVYAHFYFIGKDFSGSFMMIFALLESALILAFLAGFKKRMTYGAVFLLHSVSTLSSWKIYLDPLGSPNILFWTAWPMLAACFALYMLRDRDTKFTVCSLFCPAEKKKPD